MESPPLWGLHHPHSNYLTRPTHNALEVELHLITILYLVLKLCYELRFYCPFTLRPFG